MQAGITSKYPTAMSTQLEAFKMADERSQDMLSINYFALRMDG